MSSFNVAYNNSDGSGITDTRNLTLKATGGISFQYFWSLKDRRIKLLLILILSIFSGCLNFFFVERAGIYSPGIFSVWQSLARLLRSQLSEESGKIVYLVFFWGINSVMNIALAWATYKGIGKDMTMLSVCFIVGSAITGLVLSQFDRFKSFYIFSNPFEGLRSNNSGHGSTGTTSSSPTPTNTDFLVWLPPKANGTGNQTTSTPTTNSAAEAKGIIVLFMYAIVFATLNSLITSLLYALEACGGGIDWIIFYLFKTKSYFANKLMFYVGLSLSAFSYIVGSYLPWAIKAGRSGHLVANFFSPLFFALLSSLLARRIIFKVFYPRFEYVNVKIFTNKLWEIRTALIEEKFRHSFTIIPSYGSYLLRAQYQLEFVCLLIELQELVKVIRKIDQNCFICSLPIRSLNARIGV